MGDSRHRHLPVCVVVATLGQAEPYLLNTRRLVIMMRAGRSGHNVCVGGEEWWKGDPFPTVREKRWEGREVQKKKIQ